MRIDGLRKGDWVITLTLRAKIESGLFNEFVEQP
jgi:hypothetical protein